MITLALTAIAVALIYACVKPDAEIIRMRKAHQFQKDRADHLEGELRRVEAELHEMRVGKDRVLDAEVIG
jgi:hypothetical protein